MTFHTIASTVGTSLRTNLLQAHPAGHGYDAWVAGQPEPDRDSLHRHRRQITDAAAAMTAGRWADAGHHLAGVPGRIRAMGAEIGSLSLLREQAPRETVRSVYLLHSDTEEGAGCAEVIRAFLVEREKLWCELCPVRSLQHRAANRFRVEGLRQLVSELARIHTSCGGSMAIDATGGYKAQVAVATVFGQAFGSPVLYRFEQFDHVIEIPPMPITVDTHVVPEHLDLFLSGVFPRGAVEQRFGRPLTEANPAFAAFRVCLSGPDRIDGEDYYEISPLGQVLYTRWLHTKPASAILAPAGSTPEPRFGDHHLPDGLVELVRRLVEKAPFITRVEARNAAARSHQNGVRLRLLESSGGPPEIECTYVRDNHPAVLVLRTTARSRAEQELALQQLMGILDEM